MRKWTTMSTKILLNDQEFYIDRSYLPLLINGIEGSGASYFSVSLISNLILKGEKALFFTLAKPALDQLEKQIEGKKYFYFDNVDKIGSALNHNVIVVESGNTLLCKQLLSSAGDEKIIFIKNIEETLDDELFDQIKDKKNIILSGDVHKSQIADKILELSYKTIISFSPLKSLLSDWSKLEKRKAYFCVNGKEMGTINCA